LTQTRPISKKDYNFAYKSISNNQELSNEGRNNSYLYSIINNDCSDENKNTLDIAQHVDSKDKQKFDFQQLNEII
jgi:hypothetical protein